MVLGLTGGYCAGKNAVATLLEEGGWTAIDVDKLGHEALELSKDAVASRFGPAIIDAQGGIDRRALGALVFSDPARLADHEAIVHPVMFALVDRALEARFEAAQAAGREARVVINAAILYRMPVALRCDAIVEVRACMPLRLARARRRDGLGALAALARIRRQRPLWRLRGQLTAPLLILRNDGGPEELGARLERALAPHAALFR